ncbi:hypothetical protein HDU96_005679 [Phlyctochytrium bullatum]|nr:hypothetical protein HDU96_005679 [Phlyctochytrium bullatum]
MAHFGTATMNPEEEFIVLTGTGRNGKLSFLGLMRWCFQPHLLNNFAGNVFTSASPSPGAPTPHLVVAIGRRIMVCDEIPKQTVNSELMKGITNSSQTVWGLNKEQVSAKMRFLLIMAGNTPLKTSDWNVVRRIRNVPFLTTFYPAGEPMLGNPMTHPLDLKCHFEKASYPMTGAIQRRVGAATIKLGLSSTDVRDRFTKWVGLHYRGWMDPQKDAATIPYLIESGFRSAYPAIANDSDLFKPEIEKMVTDNRVFQSVDEYHAAYAAEGEKARQKGGRRQAPKGQLGFPCVAWRDLPAQPGVVAGGEPTAAESGESELLQVEDAAKSLCIGGCRSKLLVRGGAQADSVIHLAST